LNIGFIIFIDICDSKPSNPSPIKTVSKLSYLSNFQSIPRSDKWKIISKEFVLDELLSKLINLEMISE
jgi:hypothetical protein